MFTAQRPSLTLNDLTRLFGMGKATTHRYAMSLRNCGLLRYHAATGRYSLGIRLVGLGRIAQSNLHVIEIAGRFMDDLAHELNESIFLSVWDGETAVVMRVAESPNRTIFRGTRVGSRLRINGAHYTVFKAFLDAAPDNLELALVRQQLLSIKDSPDDDVRVIASPVFEGEDIVACLSATGSARRVSQDPASPLADRLRKAAAEISAELGPLSAAAAKSLNLAPSN